MKLHRFVKLRIDKMIVLSNCKNANLQYYESLMFIGGADLFKKLNPAIFSNPLSNKHLSIADLQFHFCK